MMFKRHLRKGIRDGRITCTVRIWQKPHVRPGGIYPMEGGHIVVESIRQIALSDITASWRAARASPASSTCSRWRSTAPAPTST